MPRTILTHNIVPLADFKARASEILNAQKEHKQPVVITQNGKTAAVLIPPEEYDFLTQQSSFIRAIEKGLADSDAGNVIEQSEMAAELASRYQPK
ncbi:MAG TPA: type II toxin-antitoxin system prevent-host-death family antitoxin [Treponemataceae bacterium]|nr:type II toxin-antitoxin system prevent-host-death family antitoxin [Treponemataceae bacterium]